MGVAQLLVRAEIATSALIWLGIGVLAGWLATNLFGALPNRRMRRQLSNILKVKGERIPDDAWFVGFATPRYTSALDPHEDVGFVLLERNQLRFVSETRTVELAKTDIQTTFYRTNVHTFVGLGRWVSIEGRMGDTPVRILLEPRTRPTLLGNLRATKKLRAAIDAWIGPVKKS